MGAAQWNRARWGPGWGLCSRMRLLGEWDAVTAVGWRSFGSGIPRFGYGAVRWYGVCRGAGPPRRGAHGAVRGAGCPFRRVLMGNGAVRGDRAPKKAGGGCREWRTGSWTGLGLGESGDRPGAGRDAQAARVAPGMPLGLRCGDFGEGDGVRPLGGLCLAVPFPFYPIFPPSHPRI